MEDIMTIDEIIHAFTYVEKEKFPIESLDSAVEKQEEITPVLLEYIQKSPADIHQDFKESKTDDLANFMWDFSMLLLAQFREKAAFPHIVEFYTSSDQSMVDAVAAEFTTEKLPSVLASTFNGDVDTLFAVAKDDSLDEFVRSSFIQASVILILHDILKLDDLRPRYIELFEQWIAEKNMTLITPLCDKVSGLADPQLRSYIDEAFEKRLVDDTWFDLDDIEELYNEPLTKDDPFYTLITDTYEEIHHWTWFTGEDSFLFGSGLFDSDDFGDDDEDTDSFLKSLDNYTPPPPSIPQETFIRDTPKVGRNDSCPCGSGKKFKKCCLND